MGAPSVRKYVPRRHPHEIEIPAIKAHACLAGEVVWAWNALHFGFASLFSRIATPHNPMMGSAIWAALATDRAQRDILRASVENISAGTTPAERRVLWVIDKTDRLSEFRNYCVHMHFGFGLDAKGIHTRPSYFANPFRKLLKLNEVKMDVLMKRLIGDLLQLSEYVRVASNDLVEGKQRTSLRRPRLQLPEGLPSRPIEIIRRRRRPRRKRQHPSSQHRSGH